MLFVVFSIALTIVIGGEAYQICYATHDALAPITFDSITELGVYDVDVYVSNLMSNEHLTTTVAVYIPITGFDFEIDKQSVVC